MLSYEHVAVNYWFITNVWTLKHLLTYRYTIAKVCRLVTPEPSSAAKLQDLFSMLSYSVWVFCLWVRFIHHFGLTDALKKTWQFGRMGKNNNIIYMKIVWHGIQVFSSLQVWRGCYSSCMHQTPITRSSNYLPLCFQAYRKDLFV